VDHSCEIATHLGIQPTCAGVAWRRQLSRCARSGSQPTDIGAGRAAPAPPRPSGVTSTPYIARLVDGRRRGDTLRQFIPERSPSARDVVPGLGATETRSRDRTSFARAFDRRKPKQRRPYGPVFRRRARWPGCSRATRGRQRAFSSAAPRLNVRYPHRTSIHVSRTRAAAGRPNQNSTRSQVPISRPNR
jgi:hypothetical protein